VANFAEVTRCCNFAGLCKGFQKGLALISGSVIFLSNTPT
jgi:hypothetical protein